MVQHDGAFGMTPIFSRQNEVKSSTSNILIFDWSNILHRAAAVSTPSTFLGTLAKMVLRHRRRFSTWRFVIALDGEKGTEARKALYPSYKANRGEHGEDFHFVEKTSEDLLGCMECVVVHSINGEADDVIATYVAQHRGERVLIVSEDRDLWQLISRTATLWARDHTEITQESCLAKLGVQPCQVPMLKALLGDKSDNLPRAVPRVKTATLTKVARALYSPNEVALLPTIEGIQAKDVAKIQDNWDAVRRNFAVVTLRSDMPLLEVVNRPYPERLEKLLYQSNFFELSREEIALLTAGSTRP